VFVIKKNAKTQTNQMSVYLCLSLNEPRKVHAYIMRSQKGG